ncbi:hypothetical protein Zmor_009248 [Zophobas morio]|uniref:Secreted protein n=1 Tax=Zophobas morio TaxID=2755281 RepID=A0AA38IKP1_9CUCU|nr:hypothetical protein Zmor_009248 [Zophobas morio]
MCVENYFSIRGLLAVIIIVATGASGHPTEVNSVKTLSQEIAHSVVVVDCQRGYVDVEGSCKKSRNPVPKTNLDDNRNNTLTYLP